MWIWERDIWPEFYWANTQLDALLKEVAEAEQALMGHVQLNNHSPELLDTLLQNVIASSAIEDERLNAESVRSSLAKRLGFEQETNYPVSDRSEGVAETMRDIVQERNKQLTQDRINQWYTWLFPNSMPITRHILVGQLRGHEPMQVVSGRLDKPHVHFEAPSREQLETEIKRFFVWFEQSRNSEIHHLIRAALAHLWFLTLHPYDDGNGRLARALTDLALIQGRTQTMSYFLPLYSLSSTILEQRKDYYRVLEETQRGDLDVTTWIVWFLECVKASIKAANDTIEQTLKKARFWQRYHDAGLSPAQAKVLNRLLDGDFAHGISAAQYQKVAKVSKATATRHLRDLLDKGCVEKLPGGGRSTRYRTS